VKGRIYANVWQTNVVIIIDPASGAVTGVVNLTGLLSPSDPLSGPDSVLNGIAYDAAHDRLFVTARTGRSCLKCACCPPASCRRSTR